MTVPIPGAWEKRPVTFSLWAKVNGLEKHNILMSVAPKSGRHWEVFTMPESGAVALYIPELGATLNSTARLTPGEWHYVALRFEADRIKLYVDGNQALSRSAGATFGAEPLLLGAITGEGGMRFDGAVDDLVIRRGADALEGAIPDAPAQPDADTLAVFSFDGMDGDGGSPNAVSADSPIWARITDDISHPGYAGARPSEAQFPYFPFIHFNPGPEYADNLRMYQGLPAIAGAPNGRLWVAWYGGGECEGADNYVMLATSGDDGARWSPVKLVVHVPGIRTSEPALWLDPQGKLWMLWTVYPLRGSGRDWDYYKELTGESKSLEKYIRDRNHAADQIWAMTTDNPGDGNPVWSAPRLIVWGVSCANKPVVLDDGVWLWPAASFNPRLPSRPLLSKDHGQTFRFGGNINAPVHPYCDEYNVAQRKDGSLLLMNRTPDGIATATSSDGGMTWSKQTPSGIYHPSSRQLLLKLASGNFLLVKHGPLDKKTSREQLMAFLSRDDGKTWEGGLMLDERGGVSYPDGFQAADGRIYVAYDYNRYHSPEVLVAAFTEDDVLAGKPVSGKARLKLLVNKATAKNTMMERREKKEKGL